MSNEYITLCRIIYVVCTELNNNHSYRGVRLKDLESAHFLLKSGH